MVKHKGDQSETSYLVSLGDLMSGLLIVSFILVAIFLTNYQTYMDRAKESKRKVEERLDQLTSSREERTRLLKQIQKELERQAIHVTVDTTQGLIRMQAQEVFEPAHVDPTERGKEIILAVGRVLEKELRPYVVDGSSRRTVASHRKSQMIDTVLIEGHTDKDQLNHTNQLTCACRDNWELSAKRAIYVFRAITQASPELNDYYNVDNARVLSFSGYGANRPIDKSNTPEAKARNRRIDIRIVMSDPLEVDRYFADLKKAMQIGGGSSERF